MERYAVMFVEEQIAPVATEELEKAEVIYGSSYQYIQAHMDVCTLTTPHTHTHTHTPRHAHTHTHTYTHIDRQTCIHRFNSK